MFRKLLEWLENLLRPPGGYADGYESALACGQREEDEEILGMLRQSIDGADMDRLIGTNKYPDFDEGWQDWCRRELVARGWSAQQINARLDS